jgi:hypothetical protein
VGGNCLPPQTATACHTCVTPQPFAHRPAHQRFRPRGGRHV